MFFGRDAQIVRGLEVLRGMCTSGVKSLFVILGPSGSGKGIVKLVSWLVAAKIGGRGRCIVVVQGTPVVRHERGMEVWM